MSKPQQGSRIASQIGRAVRHFVGQTLKVLDIDIVVANNHSAMAMASLSDGSFKRFRFVNGRIVDEATVGD